MQGVRSRVGTSGSSSFTSTTSTCSSYGSWRASSASAYSFGDSCSRSSTPREATRRGPTTLRRDTPSGPRPRVNPQRLWTPSYPPTTKPPPSRSPGNGRNLPQDPTFSPLLAWVGVVPVTLVSLKLSLSQPPPPSHSCKHSLHSKRDPPTHDLSRQPLYDTHT